MWAQGLVVKLLEVVCQWLHQNVIVHDTVAVVGLNATARKEKIQQLIEDQIDLGEEGLNSMEHYLLEVNMEDLEIISDDE